MISGRNHFLRGLFVAAIVAAMSTVLAACGAKQVVVEGAFPSPLLEPKPKTVGILYTEAFSNHEFYDQAAGRSESDWLVRTGEAQVEFWNTLLGGMFEKTIIISDHDTLHEHEDDIDAVIIPYITDLQYTIPTHTNVKVYEIWMKYRFRMVTLNDIHDHANGAIAFQPDDSFADWNLTAYGKTPTAFLQSDEAAVNLAALVALRDAGANFVTTFDRVPGVAAWLNGGVRPSPEPEGGTP